MALTQEEEQFYKIYLKKHGHEPEEKNRKPFHIKALQFSMVFLSLLLFITVGALGILTLSKPQAASASNTYTETWTATSGIYGTGGSSPAFKSGAPSSAVGGSCGAYNTEGGAESCDYSVTAWSVSGTIN